MKLPWDEEEEKSYGHTSPQFDDKLTDYQYSEVLDTQQSSKLLEADSNKSTATCGGDHSFVQDSTKRTSHNNGNITNTPSTSSSQEANCVIEHSKPDLLTHLQCAVCKQLLCRPVVLNCGHVFCEVCISSHDSVCKCPKCQSAHPNGFPNVCLVLAHFLEKYFPEEYSTRKQSLSNFQNGDSSQGPRGKPDQAATSFSAPTNITPSLFSDPGLKFHPGVGCDYCGMCPIVGVRHRCKDCVEKIGFDLCENCYNSSSKLPGRFNQQHTQDHRFEVVPAPVFRNIILSLRAGRSDDDSDSGVILSSSNLSNDAFEDEHEIGSLSVNTVDSDSQDFEDATASPTFPPNRFRFLDRRRSGDGSDGDGA
ncbi:E3 ubiquitin-protein ligase PRT1-like isoform X2 [Andrographis paniculata]|uniref:E3 ubiquitin-protein ligase PRT1-like isoform X2 n=1 Tax=Andrographis paniculata TaxID=175694 RepID=UPI0021E97D81|nr:E3 ubiquitin-protein ligase PRT1-like isoform X2 [Andrographis paniculata]